jgi:hypothetical protein
MVEKIENVLHDDKFEEMYLRQEQFTERVIKERFGKKIEELTWNEKEVFLKDLVLHITDECHEFLREINWKHHRKHDKKYNHEKGKIELVDIFKFFTNFLIIIGITPDEFYCAFHEKSDKVEAIWAEEKEND